MQFISPRNINTDVSGMVEYVGTKENGYERPMSMKKNTLIIAGFHGVGKTYEFRKYAGTGTVCVDYDNKKFNQAEKSGESENTPDNLLTYEKEILSYIGETDYLCLDTDRETIKMLNHLKVPFILVYPKRELKEEYLNRFRKRKDSQEFIDHIDQNWNTLLSDLERTTAFLKIYLGKDEYLGDALFNKIDWDTLEKLKNHWLFWQKNR